LVVRQDGKWSKYLWPAFFLAKREALGDSLVMKPFLQVAIAISMLAVSAFAAEKPKVAKGRLMSIQGIGEATEKKLTAAGVTSVDELLEKGATPAGRKELAEKSGIGEPQILAFVNHADLFRIKGIAGQTAELLAEAGVKTVAELAQRNPANLAAKLKEVNDAKKLTGKVPTGKQVGEWIEAAKTLPKKVTY
jgi:predicted flap endonuclease-1-like 5' DNA nuclease